MSFRVTNLPQALAAMSRFPEAIRRKWLRIAMNAGGGLLRRRLFTQVSRRTGLLRQSLGVKVAFLKKKPGEWHATVGARRRFKKQKPQVVAGLGIQVSKRGKIRAATKAQLRNAKASMFGQGLGKKGSVPPSYYVWKAEEKNPAFARVAAASGVEAQHVALGKILQGVEQERQKSLAMSQ